MAVLRNKIRSFLQAMSQATGGIWPQSGADGALLWLAGGCEKYFSTLCFSFVLCVTNDLWLIIFRCSAKICERFPPPPIPPSLLPSSSSCFSINTSLRQANMCFYLASSLLPSWEVTDRCFTALSPFQISHQPDLTAVSYRLNVRTQRKHIRAQPIRVNKY